MLDVIRSSAGTLVAWAKLKLYPGMGMIDINKTLRSAKKLLACLPAELVVEEILEPLIEDLVPSGAVILVDTDRPEAVVQYYPRTEILTLSRSDLGLFLLPKGRVIERIKSERVDIAIDFHREFFLPTAYLCAQSGARITAGFGSSKGTPFFNIAYQPKRLGGSIISMCQDLIRMLHSIGLKREGS